MAAPVSVREDQLTRLVALSPGDGRIAGLARRVCAETLSLPPSPAEVAVSGPASDAESVVAEFAEQFSTDVSAITGEQRSRLVKALGRGTFSAVASIYIADFVPRVRAGLEALGLGEQYLAWADGPISWDKGSDPSDLLFNDLLPGVARMRALDPVTTELVRACAARPNTTVGRASRGGRAARSMPAVGGAVCRDRALRKLGVARRTRKSCPAVHGWVNLEPCAPRRRRCRRGALAFLRC